MGLYDRDYMREEEQSGWRPRRITPWSPSVALLFALVGIFIVQVVSGAMSGIPVSYLLGLTRYSGGFQPVDPLTSHLALSLAGIKSGHVWQLLTFQFLHGGILHLALNGMTLYSFGRFLEDDLGRGRFLVLYFLSGIAGGLLQVAATWLLGHNAFAPVVGASAGISGLLGAFVLSYPDVRLMIFPIPFPMRAWTLLWIVLPLSLIGTIIPFGGIAHAAHLGGLLAGGAFIRWTWFRSRRQNRAQFPSAQPSPPPTPKQEAAKDDFMATEVDPILDKINAHGIQSLTDREREILAKAQSQIKRR